MDKVEKDAVQTDMNTMQKRKKGIKKIPPLMTLLLLVFLTQLIFGLVINSAKIYSLLSKKAALIKINEEAVQKNLMLREELEKYTSNMGVEALARDRLQLSKDDETLVIIKDIPENDDYNREE